MIIKVAKVINCSSEHPQYPVSNLLKHNSHDGWRCKKPGEMLITAILQLSESSCITGLEIGNYRSCIVIVTASTSSEPDNWVPIVNYQFLTNDEAANGKFKDQVQIFTKRDLDPDVIKIKFDRIKVTCMQSANLKELFGLSFLVLRTEVVVDLGLDVFGRFKLKRENEPQRNSLDEFKEKFQKLDSRKTQNYKQELKNKIKEAGKDTFVKRQLEEAEPKKRPILEKLEAGKGDEVFGSSCKPNTNENKRDSRDIFLNGMNADTPNIERTPFGDPISQKKDAKVYENSKQVNASTGSETPSSSRKRQISPNRTERKPAKKMTCSVCESMSEDAICQVCKRLQPPKPLECKKQEEKKVEKKPVREFSRLFEDVRFGLSGYVNPQRDEIRRKALQMGAQYIANPNDTNRCTHLICAFKNTPKFQQLKGHAKITSHKFIEDCFDKRTRFPWRRYALDNNDKTQSESEEEIEAGTPLVPNAFEEDTDTD